MAAGSVSGAARWDANSRAPAPVTVRSMTESRLSRRSPPRVLVSSRLRRVAASISITAPRTSRLGGAMRGMCPFWVNAT